MPGEGLIASFGDLASLYQVYGVGFGVLSALYAALFARTMLLAEAPDAREEARSWRDSWLICAASGVLSALVALVPLYYAPWLPPLAYPLIPLAIRLRETLVARARRRAAGPDPEPASAEA